MTAVSTSSLYCDRQTRPTVDGMEVRCCLEFGPASMTVDQLRHVSRDYGWTHTGISDFCPEHARARTAEAAGSANA